MKKSVLKFVSNTLLFLSIATTSYAEPPNLSILTSEVKAYHDSGLYEKELAKAISQAQNYILKQAELNEKSTKAKKLAVILDIDETSLSNYKYMEKRAFLATHNQLHKEILAADAPAIRPMLSLYNKARKKGIAVFFVTGRPQIELNPTKYNLLRAGYKDWKGLYLKPDNYKESSIIPFKSQIRKSLTEQGYTIVASIGDQFSDITGGYLQKGFKLPNPYYFLP
ncbi:MAG: acid phosphatase [Tatlockia sp.]|nr:acid phosphatase [Tatlockia sp.]